MARRTGEAVDAAMKVLEEGGFYPGNSWIDGREITEEDVEQVRLAIANAIWDTTTELSRDSG